MLAPRPLPGRSTPPVAAAGLSGGRRRRARSAGRGRKSACRRPCRSGRRSKTTSTRRAHTPNPCGTCPARAGSGPRGSRRDRRRLSSFRRFAERGARNRRGRQRRSEPGRASARRVADASRDASARARLGQTARGETDARGPIDAPIDRVCRAMPPGTIEGDARTCVAVWRSAPAAKPIAERAAIVRGVGAEQCGDRREERLQNVQAPDRPRACRCSAALLRAMKFDRPDRFRISSSSRTLKCADHQRFYSENQKKRRGVTRSHCAPPPAERAR